MPRTEAVERTDEIVFAWLCSAEDDSPAGPLYTGGKFAEADIIGAVIRDTFGTCSSCTASRGGWCC